MHIFERAEIHRYESPDDDKERMDSNISLAILTFPVIKA
jgi:hypothetical protein